MKKRAVLFDMDGVILDSEVIYHHSLEVYLGQFNIHISRQEMTQFIGMTIQKITNYLIKKYHLNLSAEELIKGQKETYIELFKNQESLTLMEGLNLFLKELRSKEIAIALASSSSPETVKLVADRFNLHDYFNEIISGEMVEVSKPAPDIFLYAARKVQVPPENCIVIEDSVNGILAGKSAHMVVVGYKGSVIEQNTSAADYQLRSYHDISGFRWMKYFEHTNAPF